MTHSWIMSLVLAVAAACGGGAQSAPVAEPTTGTPSACPTSVTDAANAQGGACLEPAMLGAEVTATCTAWLDEKGWVRDEAAEAAIGGQTGKTLTCYHAP
jgi:hypothetical protein